MKIRSDFVSNSSSSSFVVICDTNINTYNFNYQDIQVPNKDEGHLEFGWGPEKLSYIWDKINFCAIQLIDLKDREEYIKSHPETADYYRNQFTGRFREYFDLFKSVCKDVLKLDIILRPHEEISWGGNKRCMTAYVDHQSSVIEGKNMDMFESRQAMINFLISRDSHIVLDNDNDPAFVD